MGEKGAQGPGGRPVAFLPWVKDGVSAAAEPALDPIAELSAHVAGRDLAPSAAPGRSTRAVRGRKAEAFADAPPADASAEIDPREVDSPEDDSFAEDVPELPDPELPDPEQIADRIVRGLSRKSLSVAEVEARLYTEGVAEKDALEILERFTRFGYLDDYKMAQQIVLQLRERKKLGRSSILQELRTRKLDPDAIATALDELDGDDEYLTAMELARKRLPSLRSLSDEVAERRLTGFLARRGYAGALVQRVVRETVRKPGSSVRFR